MTVRKWEMIEFSFQGPSSGNPYTDVSFQATLLHGERGVFVPGFYDGEGVYKLRFLPDEEGEWSFETTSDVPALDGLTGSFFCEGAGPGVHGRVRVQDRFHFAYEDGTPYYEVGTTCYAWNHQPEALRQKTLETLENAPFNKLRFCIFPKNYVYNGNAPDVYPFEGNETEGFDLTRFDPRYWARLDRCITALAALQIEADLILFHPYDKGRWGFDRMDRKTDERYLRYAVARLSAYRNVWWSFANEYDLMEEKTVADWDHYGSYVQFMDPFNHLRSIHNGRVLYDHSREWVTHVSVQSSELSQIPHWRAMYGKPVVIDECCYEGDIPNDWGSLTPEAMVDRFWDAYIQGGYCGHGETYLNDREELWWSKGGVLAGQSPERIAFFRQCISSLPNRFEYKRVGVTRATARLGDGNFLYYAGGERQIREASFEEIGEGVFRAELFDAWNMTVEELPGTFTAKDHIPMPGRAHVGLYIWRVE